MDQVLSGGFSVLGIARSGLAAANYLAAHGCDVLASDLRPLDQWPPVHPGVQIAAGVNRVRPGDTVVISPGVKPGSETFKMAHELGREVISDIELFSRLCPCPIVAITGTDGKSTTTTMVGEILRTTGRRVVVAGNIGNPVMGELDQLTPEDFVVLEVSCFQLIHVYTMAPRVAILTNIAKDHVDYHGSFEAYVEAKKRVMQAMGPGGTVIRFHEDPILASWVLPEGVRELDFGFLRPRGFGAWIEQGGLTFDLGLGPRRLLGTDQLKVIGGHNMLNALSAGLAGLAMGVSEEQVAAALAAFPGLEHRMELVEEIDGVRYYNDTKATNPHAAESVLNALDGEIILLAGGSEKGSDFTELGALIARKTRAVILNGQTRDRLAQAIPQGHPTYLTDTLEQAVQLARQLSRPGDKVVLAPACASFDQFIDFEHRGREFKRWVRGLAGKE